jgi:hypothetical protein
LEFGRINDQELMTAEDLYDEISKKKLAMDENQGRKYIVTFRG